jgi:hypothetical protein
MSAKKTEKKKTPAKKAAPEKKAAKKATPQRTAVRRMVAAGLNNRPRSLSNPGGPPGSPPETWRANDVWRTLQTIIGGNPPVAKTTPMAAVLLRISASLLAQRINAVFFPSPHQAKRLSTADVNACSTAGVLFAVICNRLSSQNRLLP